MIGSRTLSMECLERRRLLIADLIASDIYLRDHQGNRVDSAPIGEQIEVVAEWKAQDLASDSSYDLKFIVNDFELVVEDVRQGVGEATFAASLAELGWYAIEGNNSLAFELDVGGEISEANETNNQIQRAFIASVPSPPFLFEWPLADLQFERYGVSSYNDVDPSNRREDYLGRDVGVNNHWGWDMGPGPFANTDSALEIVASAPGTVVWSGDGYFDRNYGAVNTGARSNGVVIDHGDGWESLYVHFRRDSVTVQRGDAVAAGQVIGLMGSSGPSGGPHIHFHITRNGRIVDPMLGQQHYFAPGYVDRFDQISITNLNITNRETLDDYQETISSSRIVAPSGGTVYLAFNVFGQLLDEPLKVSIYNPSGDLWVDFDIVARGDVGQGTWLPRWVLPDSPEQGVWRVIYEGRGIVIGEDYFEVSGNGLPELSLRHNGSIVTDNRWTPYDFEPVRVNSEAPRLTFSIENHGTASLEIEDVKLPGWITLTRPPPNSLAAGESSTFEIAASTSHAGIRWGQVAVVTNDASERRSTFQVESRIVDTALGATRVGLAFQHAIEGKSLTAKVYRTFVDAVPLIVDLSTSHPTRLSLPDQIVIPGGAEWSVFEIQVMDDEIPQDLTRVEVFASPNRGFLPSHSELLVIDNERMTPQVTIEFPTGEVDENGGSVLGRVTRTAGSSLRDEFPVQLWVENADRIRTPLWVTIPAFQESEEFRVTGLDNELAHGTQTARVVASVFGVASDRRSIQVVDDETDSLPTNVNLKPNSIAENRPTNSLVGVLTTSDPDSGDRFAYELVDGPGSESNQDFWVDGNRLLSAKTFDYENRNSHRIRVRSTDLSGNSIEQQLLVSVSDVNERPFDLELDGNSIDENTAIGRHIGWLRIDDPDSSDRHSFSLATGTGDEDNRRFQIVGGSLQTRESFNFEQRSKYSVRIRSTDLGGLFVERVFEIEIQNVAEAPTNILITPNGIDENRSAGLLVGMLSSIDEDDASSFAYRLVDGPEDGDNEDFLVVGDKLFTSRSFDHEDEELRSIRIESKDNTGLSFTRALDIVIYDINERPVQISLSPRIIAENQAIGSLVGNFSTVDPDEADSFRYALVDGEGDENNSSFSISEGFKLVSTARFDRESQSEYNIRIRSTDSGGLSVERNFVILVTDVDEPPSDIGLSNDVLEENKPIGSLVGELSSADPDIGDSAIYTLVAGEGSADNDLFTLSGDELRAAAEFDFENSSSHTVRVRATDRTGLIREESFVILIRDVNEPPTDLGLDSNSIDENGEVGSIVGRIYNIDPDAGDSFTYALVSGEGDQHNGLFTIDGDAIQTSAELDYEEQPIVSVRIEVSDSGGLKFTKSLNIQISDVNEPPTDLTLSSHNPTENRPVGTTIGTLQAIDPDLADEFVYGLAEGSSDAFAIVDDELRTAKSLDFEVESQHLLIVRVTDKGGFSLEKEFVVNVEDANDPPTNISLSNTSIRENLPAGTVIGQVEAEDQDAGDSFSYSFASGEGDADNLSFRIEANALIANASFDYEAASTRSVRIAVTDSAGAILEKAFTISILDEDEFLPEDVNADFFVSPIDALLVINHLNFNTSGPLGAGEDPRLDVTRDDFISPIDALVVINFLNQHGGGEGEVPRRIGQDGAYLSLGALLVFEEMRKKKSQGLKSEFLRIGSE